MTKRAKRATAFAAEMQAADDAQKQTLLKWRDDCGEKIAALRQKRDIEIKKITDSSGEQVRNLKTVFSEMIVAEERKIRELDSELRQIEDDDAPEGDGVGHNSDRGKVRFVPTGKAAE